MFTGRIVSTMNRLSQLPHLKADSAPLLLHFFLLLLQRRRRRNQNFSYLSSIQCNEREEAVAASDGRLRRFILSRLLCSIVGFPHSLALCSASVLSFSEQAPTRLSLGPPLSSGSCAGPSLLLDVVYFSQNRGSRALWSAPPFHLFSTLSSITLFSDQRKSTWNTFKMESCDRLCSHRMASVRP